MNEINGQTSDGFHTFEELYEHRHMLFVSLMRSNPDISWRAEKHHDGTMYEGFWFVAGIHLPTGDITYHLPSYCWVLLDSADIETRERAPEWDGHTPNDALDRLRAWCLLHD